MTKLCIGGNRRRCNRLYFVAHSKETVMDKDRVQGSIDQAKGKVKEWAGKVTGDTKTEAEGQMDQAKGKVQNTVGGMKDAARGK
jgi:uncharacterized protein YjbJ (UPF0337 family)